jgi:RNA polymerase sigma factor (sigma-70 family)
VSNGTPPPLTIKQHAEVRGALYVVDEEALRVAGMLQLAPKHHRVDDFRSIGKIALYDAVTRYDENRGSFANYGRWRVRGAILKTVKRETRAERIELEMACAVANRMADYWDDFNILEHDEAECARRLDLFFETAAVTMFVAGAERARREADEDPVAEREEYARAIAVLRELVFALEPDERALLDLLFGCGFDLQSAGDQLGVHKVTAWQRLHRLLARLKRELHMRHVLESPSPRDDVEAQPVLRTDLRVIRGGPEEDD